MFSIKMHCPKVNAAAPQPRIFTVTAFTLLMGLNRFSFGFPGFSAPEPAPAATPRSVAGVLRRHPDT